MANWQGIEYNYFTPNVGGMEMSFAPDASRITAPLQIDHVFWDEARKLFLGYPKTLLDQASNIRFVSRQTPLPFLGSTTAEDFPKPWLYATSINRIEMVAPRGNMGNEQGRVPRYEKARMWVTFSSLTYKILEDYEVKGLGDLPDESLLRRYVTGPLMDPASRQVTLRRGLLKSVAETGDTGGQNTLTEGIGLPEPGSEVVYIHHLLPADAVPWQAIFAAMGRVNDAAFDGIFPAETLLYDQPRIRRYTSPVGLDLVDLQHKFRFLPRVSRNATLSTSARGWNWLLTFVKRAADTPTADYDYRKYTLDGTSEGSPPFRPFDFKKLFRPDQP